ncbi:hypothetical protein BU23DRAFT_450279 [Bimuria novae-zelandiae CBS 107.79]|uniref:Impact N-terminal domain-containing protein n=1 Tax=Bimuria novae-zelandiae CBS 107.79 TaxID=1447943 RepID=A0A6A5VN13_9PLEO|nr:hypothetical protein BU23DRAFT_450279 [Bimuria novae-zelandiae CBS 107.79]
MASTQDLQTLLRFLSQDAKVPLAAAMSKVKDMQAAKMITPNDIAKADMESLQKIFGDDKLARQVFNAAKRVSKKRTNSDMSTASTSTIPASSAGKRSKTSFGAPMDPASFEASLALPSSDLSEEQLKEVVVFTNRAPLVLAFAVSVLKYTMPSQPLSSRLSLAQAVCSANSQSKAKYLGIQNGASAEDEGWGEGQPLVTVLNRQIRVMKRWGYTWKEESEVKEEDPASTQGTVQGDDAQETVAPEEPALWGVDLEALKNSNEPVTAGAMHASTSELPIYRPESTRAYMLKAFGSKPGAEGKPAKSLSAKKAAEEKERNLGMLLASLDLLCQSWNNTLSKEDLDKRAWSWYCAVRPEVESGAAGWGGKGDVKLADILKLRRQPG